MQLWMGLSFLWNTFGIERIVRSGFFWCNIDTDLLSGHKILTLGLGASFAFSRKINMVVTP
jgi:hypothetical protein